MSEYAAFDTETGGVNPKKNPILTLYMASVNEDLVVVDEIDLKILPSLEFSVIEQEALNVNGIDLQAHLNDPNAVTREQASVIVMEFLKKNSSNKKGKKLKPLGQNLDFDINMILSQLVTSEFWEEWVHYQKYDTMSACLFLKKAGWLPPELGSLSSMVKHFEIKQLGAHNAKNDTLMTIKAFEKLLGMLSSKKENVGLTLDILEALEK